MVVKSDEDKLFRYRKYGFGKVGYVDYNFTVSDDYIANISVFMTKELVAQGYTSENVKLNESEIELINAFVKNNILSQKGRIASFDSNIVEQY